ncbi:MAG: radical SAM protein [Candidatus Omnitrophica bacterium]|nr:radical SAM protein [Candidatus Omnitrophota bacterium]
MDYWQEYITEAAQPSYCCLALIESCFMHCKMCYKWLEDVNIRKPDEPALEQWKQAVSDLALLCKDNKPQINFAGGEPLVREETLVLIEHAQGLGFDTLLATNAFLIDKNKAVEIGRSNLGNISISLDGFRPQTHDFMRGVTGAHEKVLKAIDFIKRFSPQTNIYLNCVICELNMHEIIDLTKWADNDGRINGLGFQALTQPFSTPVEEFWYRNEKYASLWPKDIGKVNETMGQLYSLKLANDFKAPFQILNPANQFRAFKKYFNNPDKFIKKGRCHLDSWAINITPAGQVHLCFNMPSIGNIKSTSIKDMWNSDLARDVRGRIQLCRKNCQAMVNCNFDDSQSYSE